MPAFDPTLMNDIRTQFAGVDHCPVQGERIFFENAGGALTLKSVVETSARYAAIPDNQGRANPGAEALVATIDQAKADLAEFMNAPGGQFFVGESGTELLFRLITTACVETPKGRVLGSTLEHPATAKSKDWQSLAWPAAMRSLPDAGTSGAIERSWLCGDGALPVSVPSESA